MSELSIALNRFGLGARPDDQVSDARAWLAGQLASYDPHPSALARLAGTPAIVNDLAGYQARLREAKLDRTENAGAQDSPAMVLRRDARRALRTHYVEAVDARIAAALTTSTPFLERLVHFWANHFAVSATKVSVTPLSGAFEAEAIRPHVMGRFADLLRAAEQHPAMLQYLDQAQSVGVGSRLAQRRGGLARRRGLNENLAREILELHTLGVDGGYTQADVTELARALTGWSVAGLTRRPEATPGWRFIPAMHEPGARTILGRHYPEGGEEQGVAVLDALAQHPATARHLATKLTRHFAGDTPPPAMVARLEKAFLDSGGDLPTVYRAIIASPEAWAAGPLKFRTPWEWVLAALRATGAQTVPPGSGPGLTMQLGQPAWKPGQPNGFDDIAASWAGSDAIMRRVRAAERIAQRSPAVDAPALAERLFPDMVSTATAQAVKSAESRGQALALLLVAPEMMRR